MSIDDDNEDRRRTIALFRKQLLEDLIESDLPRGEISARLEEIATKTAVLSNGRERYYSVRTL
jgi:hypothetical protein